MKIAFIATYPPRKCGIATFTNNLVKAIVQNTIDKEMSNHAMIVAINENGSNYTYSNEVKFTIRQDHQCDYISAAEFINHSNADVCIIEHEFGIFGGDHGVFVLSLIHRLEIPLIVTFHTVLKDPSYTQRAIIEEIGKRAARIVVMSKRAVHFLKEIYHLPHEKIKLIEHGVPEFEKLSQTTAKQKLGLSDRKVLFTFGLLSRSKGIETVIKALPKVVEQHPDVLYMVLGATHPNVLKYSGEEYREYLLRLVKKLHLENNVYFDNEFVTEARLFEYLQACDIYITPYLNEAQITSGTLSYAIGAGCAVVSTLYWHAQELIDMGFGRSFEFKNSHELAKILLDLLNDGKKLESIRKKAYRYGKKIKWSKIGKRYLSLAEDVKKSRKKGKITDRKIIDMSLLPTYSMDYIQRLTDDTGIVQHAKYGIPNLKEGYCVDDNSRALLMTTMAYRQTKDRETLSLMPVYLSFIHYMQLPDGNFRNFLSFSRHYLDEKGSEDSFGRTVWSLGYLLRFPPNDAFRQIGREMFLRTVPYFEKLQSIRGAANTVIGIYHYLKVTSDEKEMVMHMTRLSSLIADSYKKYRTDDWNWFEDVLTYDNAVIPLALFSAYEITENHEWFDIAMEATRFLESLTMKADHFAPIGNKGWYRKDGIVPEYAQQSVDVMAMILLYHQLFRLTKESEYLEKMFKCYLWFLGENSLRLPLFDHETKGCCDGLEQKGVNRNQGAESTLAYWISHLTILAVQDDLARMQNSNP
ncbi:MAG: hypothetical protein PWQ71_233 [Bacteroidota bacterium]|jgi:glycosyltransferase involved in cell wall biosynthesis|nr:hypothetical protein [Bacteroidota bacterium]